MTTRYFKNRGNIYAVAVNSEDKKTGMKLVDLSWQSCPMHECLLAVLKGTEVSDRFVQSHVETLLKDKYSFTR